MKVKELIKPGDCKELQVKLIKCEYTNKEKWALTFITEDKNGKLRYWSPLSYEEYPSQATIDYIWFSLIEPALKTL